MRKLILVVSLLLLVPSAGASETALSNALSSAAEELVAKKEFERAMTTVFKALALDENNVSALLLLAKLSVRDGAKDEASQFYQKVYILAVDQKLKQEAAVKVAQLNPMQAKLNEVMKSYTNDLERIGHFSELARFAALSRADRIGVKLPSLEPKLEGRWKMAAGKEDRVITFRDNTVTCVWNRGREVWGGTWSMTDHEKIFVQLNGSPISVCWKVTLDTLTDESGRELFHK